MEIGHFEQGRYTVVHGIRPLLRAEHTGIHGDTRSPPDHEILHLPRVSPHSTACCIYHYGLLDL